MAQGFCAPYGKGINGIIRLSWFLHCWDIIAAPSKFIFFIGNNEMSKQPTNISLSLPIMGGMMSQNILNLVVIGRLGALALAGSGIGAFLFYVLFVFIIGLSSGVQTIVARHLGENNRQAIPLPLQLGLSISVFIAIIITGLTLFVSTPLTTLFSDNATVASIGNDYLRFRILGLPFFAICLVIRGFWNGMETHSIFKGCIDSWIKYSIKYGVHFWLLWFAFGAAGVAWPVALHLLLAPSFT